jgi:hypothetical protein
MNEIIKFFAPLTGAFGETTKKNNQFTAKLEHDSGILFKEYHL